ncbi:serine/threonine-protein kinase [Gordonia hydrophobica]|nr:serine/threonine-protein kinase [Gordonia hydrophobica]
MGDVYVVENESLKRQEAMKVISVGGASNDDFQQRFTNEARTAASLDHPSIITVHGYGVSDIGPWFTMSYIKGHDLATEHLSPADSVTVVEQVASGLDYAHARTVVHRDIKPANIVVTKNDDGGVDRAVMLDFGIAKLADSPQLTAVNSVVGTAAYTAPEIISGQAASGKSDQYSLACTAYQMFAGTAPFKAETTTALMMAHVQQPPPALGQVRPDLAPLGPVLQRAMAKDPNARYANCRAFADDLRRALGQTQAGTATSIAGSPIPSGHTPAPASGMTSAPGMAPPSHPGVSNPGMTGPGMTGPGMAAPAMTPPPNYGSQPGMTPPPPPYSGQPSQPGMNIPPGMPGAYASGPGMPQPAWGAPQPKKSKKGLWIGLAAAVVALIAIAGTAIALWPKGDDGPPPIAHPDMQLITQSGTSCAVKDKELFCWGSNSVGQVGDGSTTDRKTPVKVPGLTDVSAVDIGSYRAKSDKYLTTTCAVAEGDVYCWGSNYYSQVGDRSETERHAPAKVSGLPKVTAVVTDYGSTCAITEEKELYCWGNGEVGQLGTGNTATRVPEPAKINDLTGVKSVDGGGGAFCAVDGSDELYCWGSNFSGQLGDGTTQQRNTPVKVQSLTGVTSASLGTAYDTDNKRLKVTTCAVAEGTVHCWGAQSSLLSSQTTSPVATTGIENAAQVSVGVETACAVTEGKIWCWGNNRYGQTGNGSESDSAVSAPTVVSSLTDVSWVTTGASTTCAGVAQNNEVYCWGASWAGQIGNAGAASEKQLEPMKVSFT